MTAHPPTHQQALRLFVGTFVSAFALATGLGITLAMMLPALLQYTGDSGSYNPQLPIAEAREETFVDADQFPPKQPYPPSSQTVLSGQLSDGNWIRIPSIGVNVPLVISPSINDEDVIKTLNSGAALYPNGVAPGHLGNTFISAHSTGEPWKGKYRFAFLRINELKAGNQIHLDWNGARYTYTITGSELIKPTPDFRVISDRPVPTVTLMACWPLWTTNQRMLVKGELTNITKLTVRPN